MYRIYFYCLGPNFSVADIRARFGKNMLSYIFLYSNEPFNQEQCLILDQLPRSVQEISEDMAELKIYGVNT